MTSKRELFEAIELLRRARCLNEAQAKQSQLRAGHLSPEDTHVALAAARRAFDVGRLVSRDSPLRRQAGAGFVRRLDDLHRANMRRVA